MSEADNDGSMSSLKVVLLAARETGFLGPGPVARHLRHAQGFVDLAKRQPQHSRTPRILDLGSGGGLPGLVMATEWPEATLVLLDANRRRVHFLERAVLSCGLQGRVQVVQQRAEVSGRDPDFRGRFDGVVARSFGAPAVVAECAAPFLRRDGWMIVSEPPAETPPTSDDDGQELLTPAELPDESGRWPSAPLALLGLTPVGFVREDFGYQVLRQTELCPEKFPRRDGVPSRKPLFS
jgi:16S rRNA (guanine527-N7)-methyltransferase